MKSVFTDRQSVPKDELELQLPALHHKPAAESFKNEFLENHEPVIYGSAMFDMMEFDRWLIHNANNRHQNTVSSDWVVATTFFAVRTLDMKIIGMIDIRHDLGNDFLAQYGGHIGFSVCPGERRKGYATEILKLGLEYAQWLGIEKVMLGCFEDNIPSVKTIEKCGGILYETKPYTDGKIINIPNSDEKSVNIFWIEL